MKRQEKSEIAIQDGDTDRISALPDHDRLSSLPREILHCILSRLPEKDVARTSVLSKTWLDTWYTFPILSFSTSRFMQMLLKKKKKSRFIEMSPLQPMKEFCDYVKRSILRFWDQNLTIKEFELRVYEDDCFGLDHILKDVDILIKLACECGVEVMDYYHYISKDRYHHVLPMCVFEAKSLTNLVLWNGIKIDPTFMNLPIKFFSLRVLTLYYVLLGDEHVINNLISFCPLIESITLKSCLVLSSGDGIMEELKSLSINGLQKLKRVDVFQIQDVSIDSPSLEDLYYNCNSDYAPLKIDFDRCRNLKELWMSSVNGTFFTDKWFLEQFPTFPFLESLKLDDCKMPERIDISSVRLKVLELSHCSNMKEVNIDAPNLLSCGYKGSGASEPTISFLRNSSQLKVNIHIDVDYVDLCNLREFVQNIKPNNVLTSLALSISDMPNVDQDAFDQVTLQVSCPPPSIKHLDVHFVSIIEEHLFPSIVDFLLTSCCPAIISLRFKYYFMAKPFIELFYETLMERKDDECNCTSDNTRCWWHDLKNVKVTRSSMMIKKNVDFQTILESFPAFAHNDINIIFMLDF